MIRAEAVASLVRVPVILALALLAAAAIAGCGVGGSPPSPTPPEPSDTPEAALPPPSATASRPPPSPTPSSTPVPTPVGAALVQPEFGVTLETRLEDLAPGDYLLVQGAAGMGGASYRYVSWDGAESGTLFQLASVGGGMRAARAISISFPQVYHEVVDPPGVDALLGVDLRDGQAQQFAFDTESRCRAPGTTAYVGDRFFGYHCQAQNGAQVWHVVSLADWSIVASRLLPEGVLHRGWLDAGAAVLGSPFQVRQPAFAFCLAADADWEITCQDHPFWAGDRSPDGRRAWAWPGGESVPPVAPILVDAECLLAEGISCEQRNVEPPPEWSEEFIPDLSGVSWTPDGRALVVLNADCIGGETLLWKYDLESGSSETLASLNGCYNFPAGGSVWQSDSLQFVVERVEGDGNPMVLSALGEPGYVLPVAGSVVGGMRVP